MQSSDPAQEGLYVVTLGGPKEPMTVIDVGRTTQLGADAVACEQCQSWKRLAPIEDMWIGLLWPELGSKATDLASIELKIRSSIKPFYG